MSSFTLTLVALWRILHKYAEHNLVKLTFEWVFFQERVTLLSREMSGASRIAF